MSVFSTLTRSLELIFVRILHKICSYGPEHMSVFSTLARSLRSWTYECIFHARSLAWTYFCKTSSQDLQLWSRTYEYVFHARSLAKVLNICMYFSRSLARYGLEHMSVFSTLARSLELTFVRLLHKICSYGPEHMSVFFTLARLLGSWTYECIFQARLNIFL